MLLFLNVIDFQSHKVKGRGNLVFNVCFFIFPVLLFLLIYELRYQIKVTILSDLNSEGLTGNV